MMKEKSLLHLSDVRGITRFNDFIYTKITENKVVEDLKHTKVTQLK